MLASKLNYKRGIQIGISLVVLLTTSVSLATEQVYLYSLKALRLNAKFSLASLSDKPKVAVVFQPNCAWCIKQAADLARLQNECSGEFETVLIGSRAKRQALKRELRHFSDETPALQADPQFIRQIGGVEATPVTLFFDQAGNLLGRKQGYLPVTKLRQAIAIQTNKAC